MDQIKYQKIASCVTESIKCHQNVFKITQVLVSLSVCSFILFSSPSSSSLHVFLHYFKFYLSTFPFQLFTHNIDKNSMFLLCNGLLVFVGITRSFSGSRDDADQDSVKYGEEVEEEEEEVMMMEEKKTIIEEHNIIVAEDDEVLETKQYDEEQEEEAEDDDNIVEQIIVVDEEHHHDHDHNHDDEQVEEEKELHEEEEEENNELFDDAEQEDEENVSESDDQFLSEGNFEEEEEEEEEEESNMLSTEELNKKFEDFIRRMKQDLRIEAQRQLVMV